MENGKCNYYICNGKLSDTTTIHTWTTDMLSVTIRLTPWTMLCLYIYISVLESSFAMKLSHLPFVILDNHSEIDCKDVNLGMPQIYNGSF